MSTVYSSAGGGGTIDVVSDSGCAWQAVSNAAWVTINSGSPGIGNGTVGYTVAANPGPKGRGATIKVAGLTFSIKQQAF
jgi:hypothetical protein